MRHVKLLLLGGTKFLGRHLTEAALQRGHEVTLCNRGMTEPELFPEVERIRGDRDGGLEALMGRHWDAVIDTCGYVPRIVEYSASLLKERVKRYVFISSISVFKDFSVPGLDESAPVAELEDPSSEDVSTHYGPLKAKCESTIRSIYGENRSLIIRPGLIVGPYDPTDRFTYWPVRFAQGGQAIVPGRPERQIQFIDARDLADWIIRLTEAEHSGIFNAAGPQHKYTMGELIEACRLARPQAAEPVWVKERFLLDQGVEDWKELPLWVAENRNWDGFLSVNNTKALETGLRCRAPAETAADTWNWAASVGKGGDDSLRTGLSKEKEAKLLQLWTAAAEQLD